MKKQTAAAAAVYAAALMNIGLTAFFIVLAFGPPVIFREPPRGLPYLIMGAYPLINFIALVFPGRREGIVKAVRWFFVGFNALLFLIIVAFGISLALERVFILLASIPPALTAVGFYAQGRRLTRP